MASAAVQQIIARTALKAVVGPIPNQAVCTGTADHVFNRDQGVGAITCGAAAEQIHNNSSNGRGVVSCVAASAAIQPVIAGTVAAGVVAARALECVPASTVLDLSLIPN